MKINNTSVQGIFKYNPSLEYEAGDFVILEDNTLWVAKKDVPVGGDKDEYFEPYLSSKVLTMEEYQDEEKDGFMSTALAYEVLESMMFGVTTTGLSNPLEYNLSPDELMTRKNINNAIVHFPRSTFKSIISKQEGSDIFIHQYAYKVASTGNTIKVQVMIDPEERTIRLRSYLDNQITPWTASLTSTTKELAGMVEAIQTYYTARVEELDNIVRRFDDYILLQKINASGVGTGQVTGTFNGDYYIMLMYTPEGSSVSEQYSLVVDTSYIQSNPLYIQTGPLLVKITTSSIMVSGPATGSSIISGVYSIN